MPVTGRFSLPGWHVWCGSVVENPSGSGFSLFFSCWPGERGHDGWVTHSEIWRAEGPTPTGPFGNPQVIWSRRAERSWDADNFHNVTVRRFQGRYYMYYTGNHGDGAWWSHRNNQRIGVAVADRPEGPWTRLINPLIDVSPDAWDSLCVTNPTVAARPEGGYLILYKGVTLGDLPYGTRVLHGAAWSEQPDGPFHKLEDPVFDVVGSRFAFEDPYLWFEGGRYHCLMKDMAGLDGSYPRATLLFHSADGLQWDTDHYRVIATPHLRAEDGTVVAVDKLERPAYFPHPTTPMLSFAVKPLGDGLSYLIFSAGRLTDFPG